MKNENNFKDQYINFAASLILAYKGDKPFHIYLKSYFKSHKKHGSRDRKRITSFCYNFFRLGSGVILPMSMVEKIILGDQVAGNREENLESKLNTHSLQFDFKTIFPYNDQLSNQVDQASFNKSFLIQPLLFIRMRPGYENKVPEQLALKNISFKKYSDNCIGIENATGLENIFEINKEIVIQDFNSQRISLFFEKMNLLSESKIHLWDACAASGGKSILATDYFKNIQLTVTDKRKTILENLEKRFGKAGINGYQIIKADLSKPVTVIKGEPFDLIIADVPCSGSGTWSRTPEQLHFFEENDIDQYADLQRSIVSNCISKLKPTGYLLYVTCSVFTKENEENVKYFCKQHSLKIIHQQYLHGYEIQADTLFGALFQAE